MDPKVLAHSTEHVFAQAIKELFKDDIKLAVAHIENNVFSTDFYCNFKFTEEHFSQIEKKMLDIVKSKLEIKKETISKTQADEYFKDNIYKLEWVKEHFKNNDELTIFRTGDKYFDLCKGPHLENTSQIKAFKLMNITGAYFRGDEKNDMLTRVHGISFESKEELDTYIKNKELEKENDHRKIGKEMGLFTFDDEVGPGLPLWLPNGAILTEELENLAKKTELKLGYKRVRTPHITKENLYIKSGHLPYYKESMFPPMQLDNETYYLKPMNCPHHHKIYASEPRSYKELPLKLAEYGQCYRYEDSGSLQGLYRVRALCMNDAHIYCTEEQFEKEFREVIDMYIEYFRIFGITKFQMRLSKHSKEGLGKKYVDNEALWIKTEEQVRQVLINANVPFVEAEDEAAFYGPKIDVQIWSIIGREFTLSTNQLDFAVPERFELKYKDFDGELKTPLCIHRAPLGTHERFIGFLTEHFGGKFPLWLSPQQVLIIPISSEKHFEYSQKIANILLENNIRVGVDASNETLGNRIRKALPMRVPYIAVIGDKEMDSNTLAIRKRGSTDTLGNIDLDSFIKDVKLKIESRDLNLTI